MMATRSQAAWIRTGRRILQQVKDQLAGRLGPADRSLSKYGKAFDEEVAQPWHVSSKSELLQAAENADVIFGADFHAFAQSQRLHLRILRNLSKRPRALAVECVDSEYQPDVDLFLGGDLTDVEFCERIRWSENWGFAWSHYKPLFDFAKQYQLPVLALNQRESSRTEASLKRRDLHAAEILAEFHRHNSNFQIYVVFGDLHVATAHLPSAFQKQIENKKSRTKKSSQALQIVTIFQNVDDIFFRLARRGLALDTNVVRRGQRRFCVLNAPPWVKWQSYLLYLERAFDLRSGEDEDLDYTDHVITVGKMLLEHLSVRRVLDDLSVYSSSSLSVLDTLESHLNARELSVARGLMERNRGFFVPSGGILYLGRPTLNQAATLFGHYIQARLSGRKRMLWHMPRDFQRLIWVEALGFFTSKLLNHQRKSESLDTLRTQAAHSSETRDVLYLALDQSVREIAWLAGRPLRRPEFIPRKKMAYYEAARVLGSLMGEQLLEQFHARGADVARRWFQMDVDDPEFMERYRQMALSLKPLPQILRRNANHL